jgi:predicted CopG family antitoxin
MRTTIDIPDDIYRKLKVKAAMEGKTVREIVLRAIQRELELAEAPPLPNPPV